MKSKEFQFLLKSEIKKICKLGGGQLGQYFGIKSSVDGFYDIVASVVDYNCENIIAIVNFTVVLFDRRQSYVSIVQTDKGFKFLKRSGEVSTKC